MRLGDLLATVFRYTGIKWLVKKIVVDLLRYESCGCEERQKKLNEFKLNWDARKANE